VPTPTSADTRRKRCLNCNKLFVPRRNVGKRAKFCKKECCDEFHRHGSAFGPMKLGLYTAIDKKFAALEAGIKLRFREAHSRIETLEGQLGRLRMELVGLKEELERHTHNYLDGTGPDECGEAQTSVPSEVAAREREKWRAESLARLSNETKSQTKSKAR
jgi:hypothetical protein